MKDNKKKEISFPITFAIIAGVIVLAMIACIIVIFALGGPVTGK